MENISSKNFVAKNDSIRPVDSDPLWQILKLGFITGSLSTLSEVILRHLPKGNGMLSDLNLELMVGSMFGFTGFTALVVGFGAHLLVSILLTALYSFIFEVVGDSSLKLGVLLSVPHTIVSGLAMGLTPYFHQYYSRSSHTMYMQHPGIFMYHYGIYYLLAFIVYHIIFGITVGALYRKPKFGKLVRAKKSL